MAAIRAYGSVESFRGRANPIESAGEAYFKNRPNDALRQAINDLMRLSTTKFGARRSEIAHGIVNPYFKIEKWTKRPKGVNPISCLLRYEEKKTSRKRPIDWFGIQQARKASARGSAESQSELATDLHQIWSVNIRERNRMALTTLVRKARSSSTPPLMVGVTALALAMVLNTSVASSDVVSLGDVDGGQDYYGQFANGLPSDPSYFPLAVWLESVTDQGNVNLDKDAGLNLYVGLTSDSNLSLVQGNGMRVILLEEEWRAKKAAVLNPAVAGWTMLDEIDMSQGPDRGYTTLTNILARLPNDGRMRYNNYGKGVMFWESNGQAARFVNDFQQVVSNGTYWFTDPNISGSSEGGKLLNGGHPLTLAQTRRAANYGYTVDRMRDLAMGRRPIWSVVEVGWPFSESAAQGARQILPEEIKAAVWHSIIARARGIIYFNHSFGGPHPSQHCLRDPAYSLVRRAVKSTNQLVTQLAPVLNAPFADGFVRASPSVRTIAKFHENKYYIFAGSKENVTSTPTFSLSGVDSGTATVIDENRTIPISSAQFSDSFSDGNAIHIYRIDN